MKKPYRRFIKYTVLCRKQIEYFYTSQQTPSWQSYHLSFSFLVNLWLRWNFFCRQVVLLSCQGTIDLSGRRVLKRLSADNTWERVSHEVKSYGQNKTPNRNKKITYHRHEPTWGDVNLLLKALPRLNLGNSTSLLAGFGMALKGPRHLQIIRNACVHLDEESMKEVKRISTFYKGKELKHPVDLIWWTDSAVSTDVIYSWIDDLENIALVVTK